MKMNPKAEVYRLQTREHMTALEYWAEDRDIDERERRALYLIFKLAYALLRPETREQTGLTPAFNAMMQMFRKK